MPSSNVVERRDRPPIDIVVPVPVRLGKAGTGIALAGTF